MWIKVSTHNITEDYQKLENAGLTRKEIEKLFTLQWKLERLGLVKSKDYPIVR